jgi:flagellar hook-associated protein 2
MADSISIPGVTDKYNTKSTIEALMAVERKPLDREKQTLETYKSQESAWRDVNQKMTALRESVKTLYSFENPFNNKLASSTDENAITAEAGREAEYGTFKVDIINPATADRFLSGDIDKNMTVPAGNYSYTVGDKTIQFNWKGGKLSDWVAAVNKRSGQTIKASLIGVTKDKQSLLIESLKTGTENKLEFKDAALSFAKSIDMLHQVKSESKTFSAATTTYTTPATKDTVEQQGMPAISKSSVQTDGKTITIPPRGGIEIPIPDSIKTDPNQTVEFTLAQSTVDDITDSINKKNGSPTLPSPGGIEYKGVSVSNNQSDTSLPVEQAVEHTPLTPIQSNDVIFVKNNDGSETAVSNASLGQNTSGDQTVTISMKEYPNAQSIIVRNSNTGKTVTISIPQSSDSTKNLGYGPTHAITTADDARFKYEGITLTRASNDVDDVIPHVTLHLHDKTDKTATIKINPDKDSAKNALITFVGKYNQTLAEMTILTVDKPEVITELDYLSKDEQEAEEKKLGMFMGDFSLSNGKNAISQITAANYRYSENSTITMLSQIGISTNASSNSGGYNASQLRGYLEVDEKKLDAALSDNLDQIKSLFGFDSDGDLIIDNGIGYKLDKQLTAWVQSGGLISTKTSTLDRSIKSSNEKIAKLETQLDEKEAELKSKYASMEGTLNSLESQSSSISNFSNQNKQ